MRFICRWIALFSMVAFSIVISPASSLAAQEEPATSELPAIQWQKGPAVADLGGLATVQVPTGFAFTGAAGTKKFLAMNQNPSNNHEVGLLIPIPKEGVSNPNWFMLFDYNRSGYISDTEKSSLDQGALLDSLKRDTEDGNKLRKDKGWPAFHIDDWSQPPFYDSVSHNLTWGVVGQADGDASRTVNYSTRILGRSGTMNVDLVLDPRDLPAVLPQLTNLLSSFTYTKGNRYTDFVKGDRLAGYGLTALIAGGVGAAAVKTGLLASTWKLLLGLFAAFYKLVLVGVAAVSSMVIRLFKQAKRKITGDEEVSVAAQSKNV